MSQEFSDAGGTQKRKQPESQFRYILAISLSLGICALLGAAYVYI